MAIRLGGLISGMDTESMIQQLVEAKSIKVTTAKKSQTKLEWKQDAWKSLNSKLKNLQSKYLSSMRFSTAYTKKTTKVSNSNAVSVITGEDAVNGVQSLEVKQLAKTGYLTGGVVSAASGEDVTALTKVSELTGGFSGPGTVNVKAGNTSVDINITSDTTISDVLTQLKNAGLNASFDAKWQRFSVSSKNSGAKSDFSITAVDEGGKKALEAMKLQTKLTFVDENGNTVESAAYKEYKEYSDYFVAGDKAATIGNMQGMIDKDVASRTASYLKEYESLTASLKTAQDTIDAVQEKYKDTTLDTAENYEKALKEKNDKIVELNKKLNEDTSLTEDQKKEIQDQVSALMDEVKDVSIKKADAESLASAQASKTELEGKIADVEKYVDITPTTVDGKTTYSAAAKQTLKDEVADRYYDKAEMAHDVIVNNNYTASEDAFKVNGQDAKITLNGAVYSNSTNTFEINGLTFTALAETKAGEAVTVTTEQDVDGIYDLVKNFLKEYNAIVNEMDKLYNADSARGYEPLSDDEREAMSEKDIEKYEQKIKDALLRRDDNLSTVSSALKNVMSSGIDVKGKTLHLFDFGIETLSYFTAAENEKNAYHIAGDPDDANTSGNADLLKSMIANDPDTTISFFTKLSQNLYDKMSELSKGVDGYRTFGNFYDDKKMKSDYDDYTSKIKDLEKKLNDYEDSWYKKFAAMETTMAKMQQNTSAVTALLGGQ